MEEIKNIMQTVIVMGDEQRLVVKNLIRDLIEMNIKVSVIQPDSDKIAALPTVPHHLILCLSDTMDFSIVRQIITRKKTLNMWLYITGKIAGLSIDEDNILKRFPDIISLPFLWI